MCRFCERHCFSARRRVTLAPSAGGPRCRCIERPRSLCAGAVAARDAGHGRGARLRRLVRLPSSDDATASDDTDDRTTSHPRAPADATAAGRPTAPARPRRRAAVRSGLAHRRNPVLVALGDFCSAVRGERVQRPARAVPAARVDRPGDHVRCCCSGRSSRAAPGRRCRSAPCRSSPEQHQIATAVLLDHDNRVEVDDATARRSHGDGDAARDADGGEGGHDGGSGSGATKRQRSRRADRPAARRTSSELWAAYPASGAQTQQLLRELLRRRRDGRRSISSRARARGRSSSSS